MWASLAGQLQGDPAYFKAYFADMSANPVIPVFWTVAILFASFVIIDKGVRNGIERASKWMMPTLFILLLFIVVASCMLPNAVSGIEYLFKPDFSKVNGDVFLGALGQAFYSLSIAMGALSTYASYFSRQTNLTHSASQIAIIACVVAVLAGLMIFPAAFSVGISPDSGPSLIFITLPNVFQQAFAAIPVVGYVVELLFFVLLSLAALTSLISLHEAATAFLEEEKHVSRRWAAFWVTVAASVIGAFCSLSLGAVEGLSFFGKTLFDWFDFVTGQILLPIGGFLTCLLIGWILPRQLIREEFTNWGTLRGRLFGLYLLLVRFVCPLAILFIFLHQFELI